MMGKWEPHLIRYTSEFSRGVHGLKKKKEERRKKETEISCSGLSH